MKILKKTETPKTYSEKESPGISYSENIRQDEDEMAVAEASEDGFNVDWFTVHGFHGTDLLYMDF